MKTTGETGSKNSKCMENNPHFWVCQRHKETFERSRVMTRSKKSYEEILSFIQGKTDNDSREEE